MDLTRFDEDEFNVRQWVNDTLRAHQQTPSVSSSQSSTTATPLNIEMYTSTVIVKLQVLITDLSSYLEKGCEQAIKRIPSALLEIDRMTQLATQLSLQIHALLIKLNTIKRRSEPILSQLQTLDTFKQRLLHILNTLTQAKTLSISLQSLDQCFKHINTLIIMQSTSLDQHHEPQNAEEIEEAELNAADLLSQVETGIGYLREYDVVDKQDVEKIETYRNTLLEKVIAPRFARSLIKHDIDGANTGLALAKKLGANSMDRAFDLYAEHVTRSFLSAEQSMNLSDIFKEILFLVRQEAGYFMRLNFEEEDQGLLWSIQRLLHFIFIDNRKILETILDRDKNDIEHLVGEVYSQAKLFVRDLKQEIVSHQRKMHDLSYMDAIVLELFVQTQQTYVVDLEKKYLQNLCIEEPLTKQLQEQNININRKKITNEENEEEGDTIIRIVDASVSPLFANCSMALTRCVLFTGGMEIQSLIRVLNHVLVAYGDMLHKIVAYVKNEIKERRKIKGKKTSSHADWYITQQCLKLYIIIASSDENSDHSEVALSLGKRLKQFEDYTYALLLKEKSNIFSSVSSPRERDYYLKQQFENHVEKTKQLQNFFRSMEEVRLPIFSQARKHFEQLQAQIVELLQDTLFFAIRQALDELTIKQVREDQEEEEEEDDDDEMDIVTPSEYMNMICDYLFTLPSRLETLNDNEEMRYWSYRICQDAVQELREKIVQLYGKSQQRWTKFAKIQFLSDLHYLRSTFDRMAFQGDDATTEFFELSKKILEAKEGSQGIGKKVFTTHHQENAAFMDTLKQL